MRIVHMPYNVASFASESVRALRGLGHDARGLVFQPFSKSIKFEGLWNISHEGIEKSVFKKLNYNTQKYFQTIRHILWADVIHWYWDADLLTQNLELKLIKWLNKPVVVEWLGSDIRNPAIEFLDNPFYENVYLNEHEYSKTESVDRSSFIQRKFASAGFIPVLCPDMEQYIVPGVLPFYFKTHQRVNLGNFPALYPSIDNKRPLVVHSSSARITKGTRFVEDAISALKNEFDFDFVLIENKTNSEAMQLVSRCDIYLDQFILGCHGMAAVEAFSYGKPVIGFIKDSLIQKYPEDLPIISANPHQIAEKLRPLLTDAGLRNSLGKKSRAYAEKYHDAEKVAKQLIDIYEKVIEMKKKKHLIT